MRKFLALVSLCGLSACTATPTNLPSVAQASGSQASEQSAALVTPVETVNVAEIDNSAVCVKERRAGSRIPETFCFSQEEYAAREELKRQQAEAYADALDEDMRNREVARQERERQGRRGVYVP